MWSGAGEQLQQYILLMSSSKTTLSSPSQPARHCQFLCEITSTKSKVNQIYREKCFCVWFWKLFKSCKLWQVSGVNSITKRGSSGVTLVTFVTDSNCWLLMAIMGVPRLPAGSMNVWRLAVAYLLRSFSAALLIFFRICQIVYGHPYLLW